ncbi:hypothetical protein [Phenylobacterium sp.]|jgi:hypothetical protein|uniref:hypothetical protein n=1 Tax=Phenylobacterium sp. TaxID=1871053 RepID=UPI0037CA78AF
MAKVGRRRNIAIASASVAAHVLVLTLVALHSPRLIAPRTPSGPPIAIIPILIVPRLPPTRATTGDRPAPIRLHRRPQRFVDETSDVTPLITPRAEAPRPAPAAASGVTPAPPPANALTLNARAALRGRVGCANAAAVGLSRAEREACEDQLASGAKDAPFQGLGLARGKAADLARAAAGREADFRYKRGLPGPPVPVPAGAGWDAQRSPPKGAPNMGMGASSHDLGAEPLKVPF